MKQLIHSTGSGLRLSKVEALKICLITDTWFPVVGGGPIVVWNYAKKLTVNHRCKVDIITRRFNQQDNYHLEKINNLRILKVGPGLAWDNIFARFLFIVKTFLYLLSSNYDIVHAFPFVSGLPVWLYGLLTKKPVVFSVFALRNHILENFLTFGLFYKLLISDNKEIVKKYKHIKYLADGVDIAEFAKVKIKKDKFPRLLFVGRFHKQKGIQNLLKATKVLVAKFPTLRLVLIGYGNEENNLRSLINELKIKKYVQIKPPKFGIDLIKEYKKSHLFVLPSLYEGQGIVVLEAWAAKIPVVVTKVGSLKYVVRDWENGLLVEPNNVDQLTKGIARILNNKKIKSLGETGYKEVKTKYNWTQIVNKLYQEYLHLIN